jgi:hypothetical protein
VYSIQQLADSIKESASLMVNKDGVFHGGGISFPSISLILLIIVIGMGFFLIKRK